MVEAAAGLAELVLAPRDGRTRLVRSRCRPPLQIQRALHPDPLMPNQALVMLANPTGGIFQGDRHRISISVESGGAARVTTQGASRIHSMPQGSARQRLELTVGAGAHLEYLPDAVIPYRDSDFEQETTLSVASGGVLIYWDIFAPGRVAMGENFRYRRLANRLDVIGPDGFPAYREAFAIDPNAPFPLARRSYGDRALGPSLSLGSMLVVADEAAGVLLPLLQKILRHSPDVAAGVTRMPNDVGLGIRAIGADTAAVQACFTGCLDVARRQLLGVGPAPNRKDPASIGR